MKTPTRCSAVVCSMMLVFVGVPASAQSTWVTLPKPGANTTLRVDTASITTIAGKTFGTFRWTGLYASDTTPSGARYASVERSRVADCAAGTIAFEQLAYYAAADTIIDGVFWEQNEWQFAAVQDGSPDGLELGLLCRIAQRHAQAGIPLTRLSAKTFIVRPTTTNPDAKELSVPATLAGFRLGQPLRIARPLVGQPLRIDTLSATEPTLSLVNSKTGVTVVGSSLDGVVAIFVTTRDAGVLDDIRVGDRRSAVIARWGPPAAETATAALWLAERFMVSVNFDSSGVITRLGIGQ